MKKEARLATEDPAADYVYKGIQHRWRLIMLLMGISLSYSERP